MSAYRKSGSKLRIEGLEKRLMMAGNITATLQAGNLLVTGDGLDNGVSIVGSAVPGEFVVQGLPTNYVPTTVIGKHTFEKVRNITIDLKTGADIVRIGNATADLTRIPGGLTVAPAPGNKTLTVSNVSVGGMASMGTGIGDDTVTIRDSVFEDTASLSTRAGNDLVTVANIKAKKEFTVDTGMGDDTVVIRDSAFRELYVYLGDGNDSLTVRGNVVGRPSVLDGGAGWDKLNKNWRQVNTGDIIVIHFEACV